MRTWLLTLLLPALLTGCAKKSSKAYFEAQRQYESLVSREGEDAFLTEEMAAIAAALAAVPENAREYPQAQALTQKISSERTRLEAERRAAEAEAARQPEPTPYERPVDAPPPAPEPIPPSDVVGEEGPPQGGMSLAAFNKRFARCVTGPTPYKLAGKGEVPTFKATGTPDCLKLLGLTEVASFFFVDGALAGRVSITTTTTRVIVDGGAGGVIVGPPQPFTVIPGAPLPPGATQAAPPTPGTLDTAKTGQGMAPTKEEGGLAPRANP